MGASPPNRGNITLLWLFCYPVLIFLDPAPSSNRRIFLFWMAQITCFRPRTVLSGVGTMDDVIWENIPQKLSKRGVNSSFKPKRQNLYIAIFPELLIRRTCGLRTESKPRKALRGWSAITPKQIQHGWRPPSWKSIWRHISAADVPIWTKFGSRMQNNTPITVKWSGSKPKVQL